MGSWLRTWLWLPLAGIAFRTLYLGESDVAPALGLERALFDYEAKSPLLAIGVGFSLLWSRREDLAASPHHEAPRALYVLLPFAMGTFVLAQQRDMPALLLLSFALHVLAFATARWGRSGLRWAALPAAGMLLGAPIPAPLESQLLWTLQVWTTEAAGFVLDHIGSEAVWTSGTTILYAGRPFLVIEACSGLSGIEILIPLSLVIREFFRGAGARLWLVVAAAPALGFALNVARVCWIASLPSSDLDPGHTLQGLSVIMLGTILLYLLAWSLAGRGDVRADRPRRAPGESTRHGPGTSLWACALVGLSFVPALGATPELPRGNIGFPRQIPGWKLVEDFTPDRLFLGSSPVSQVTERRYQQESEAGGSYVDLFIAAQDERRPATALYTEKLTLPGRGWKLLSTRPVRLWSVGIDATLTIAHQGRELVLACSWEVSGGQGALDHWRAWLGLPLRRTTPRYVVRVATPLASPSEGGEKQARDSIERFVSAAVAELQRLQAETQKEEGVEPAGSTPSTGTRAD